MNEHYSIMTKPQLIALIEELKSILDDERVSKYELARAQEAEEKVRSQLQEALGGQKFIEGTENAMIKSLRDEVEWLHRTFRLMAVPLDKLNELARLQGIEKDRYYGDPLNQPHYHDRNI